MTTILHYVSSLDVNSLINGAAGLSAYFLTRELKRSVKELKESVGALLGRVNNHEARLGALEHGPGADWGDKGKGQP